ncbi:Glycerophosphodiester phosphodiesterase domain-containing protein 5 [Bagarius yarrelli]|uniref:Glycerophosphodiester phosphodiesterase domain-containing protein 5 n=1 Tax=Bagarius yarrelli TaxID=175774 RepID=A0A556VBI9_BAGYA|nr:Glycerophosphodiester phosphodiesterase domain-containing protein 5 [Bagarius yarrelli]
MGRSPISLSTLKLGRLKVIRRQLLQRYEHQPFVSCLAGLYGCQWRRYQRTRAQPGECCCSRLEFASFILLTITFFLSLVFLCIWSVAQNDYDDFDWFNFGKIGFWFPWSVVLLVVAAALFTYIALLLVLAVCLLSEGQRLYLHWSHKVNTLYRYPGGPNLLRQRHGCALGWSKALQTLILSFQVVTAPFLHVGGVSLMTVLSWPIALHFFRMNKRVRQAAMLSLYLAVLFALYLVPLGMYSPCIKEEGSLGPAPILIGHRGAPMLAPENTQLSFQKAVEVGAEGLETDVTISYDGVPFLMHDSTLKRTTDVRKVFPDRTNDQAAMFTWDELEMLNAGDWFLQRDPFGTASSLDPEDRAQVKNQTVPTLKEFLDLAALHKRLVIFDLYRPPPGHPYRNRWITRTLEIIHKESFINSHQKLDPDLQQTSGSQASIEELQENNIVRLNLHYSFIKYASVNISTNLYVISQPWLFSLAWCAGAHSVTTNAPHLLKILHKPVFLMTPQEYSLMWSLTDVVSAILITVVFIFHWWRERGLPFWSDSKQVHENGLYSKFRTEMSDVWSISSLSVRGEGRGGPITSNLPTITEEPQV